MWDEIDWFFEGLFDAETETVIPLSHFLICVFAALAIGLIMAFSYMYRSKYSKSFVATIALLPAVVCVVIMLVNGNVGTGVAVAGAFSLVRFRSAPGSAKEIGALFLAMGAGLIAGMGYIAYAFLFTILMCAVSMLYARLDFGEKKRNSKYRTLRVTIPEDLNYTEVFTDILARYTASNELVSVKTTNMGSLFRLTYDIKLKDASKEKELIDELRCRNGNLEIVVSKQENTVNEL